MHGHYLSSQSIQPAPITEFGGVVASTSSSSVPHNHQHSLLSQQQSAQSAVPTPVPRDELKTHFATREGTYRVMTLAEYSRPNRVPLNQAGNSVCSAPVRVSFLSVGSGATTSPKAAAPPSLINGSAADDDPLRDADSVADRICFNVGREIYVYLYKGTTSAADLSKPIDKRVYKGTTPTCHHFNQETATSTSCSLLIGFSAGQVQLIDPFQKEYQVSRLFNEDRLIEKTAVTCIKWVPGHPQHFLVSHASGSMYLYYEDLPCAQSAPVYQLFKQGDKFAVYTCKAKSTRNPVYKWQIGYGSIQQFAFSPSDPNILAIVGHDGYLRMFSYHSMELLSWMKSYFGGILCLAWSPDGALIATGGEDDLLTVYSFAERRVVCRGQGHKSWISQVAFDPYTCVLEEGAGAAMGSDEDLFKNDVHGRGATSSVSAVSAVSSGGVGRMGPPPPIPPTGLRRTPLPQPGTSLPATASSSTSRLSFASAGTPNGSVSNAPSAGHALGVTYRLGSVGHDTQLCLWDITDDVLKQPVNSQRHRNSTLLAPLGELQLSDGTGLSVSPNSLGTAPTGKEKKKRAHRRGFAFAAKLTGAERRNNTVDGSNDGSASSTLSSSGAGVIDDSKLLGTRFCPRMNELPLIEPLICKKIAHERLTVLEFRKDCFVTACQEGFICTWARPGKGAPSIVRREGGVSNTTSPHDAPTATFMPPGTQYWSS